MIDSNYNFPVELQPIFLSNGQEIKDKRAVVRTDTMLPLGVVSDDYGLVKHTAVVDAFRQAGLEHGVQESLQVTNGGGNLFYKMLFPKVEYEIRKGDIVRLQMIAKNSYNGTNSLSIIFGALRLVCLNGMVVGQSFMQFKHKHIGTVGGMVDETYVREYTDALKGYVGIFAKRMEEIQPMVSRQLPVELLQDGALTMDKELFDSGNKLPDYLIDEAKYKFHSDNDYTVWGYYNSLTYAITHRMKRPSPQAQINYGQIAWKMAEKRMTA